MEYLDKNGLAHLVKKNNETYALKKENNNLKDQVQSLKTKLKKRDKKIVVRKAINPNSVTEGNVWYYHHNPTLLMGNGYSRHKIFINGEEVTRNLRVVRGCTSDKRHLKVQYSKEQKRYWIYYIDDSGNNTMWLENLGIVVNLLDTYIRDTEWGYLSRVTAVEYDESLNMKIIYIEMKMVHCFTHDTSCPYLRIGNGKVISNGKVPFVDRIPRISLDRKYKGPTLNKENTYKTFKLYLMKINKVRYIQKPNAFPTRKYTLCTGARHKFPRGEYMLKIFKRGIYCGNIKFCFFKIYGGSGNPRICRKMV